MKRGGSRKGIPNKLTHDLRAMVEGALQDAGGRQYLAQQAIENPAAFMSLVGKCLPRDVKVTGELTLMQLLSAAMHRAESQVTVQ